MRLDIAITEQFALTRNKAQQLIECGLVLVNGECRTKSSMDISLSDRLELIEDRRVHWVARSAEKLEGFLDVLQKRGLIPEFYEKKCLDVGSSTGGFTQVLLERGVSHVDAVDVGTDQLHPSLRLDHRVTSYEQTDIRDFALYHSALTPFPSSAPFPLLLNSKYYDIIVCDASFISLQDILPSMLTFANGNTDIFLLWKPQFEVGREHLRKTGVPKSEKVILEKQKIWENFLQDTTCKILHKEKATLPGEAGNQEWIYHICKSENNK